MISSANTRIGEVGHVTISSSLFGTSRQCKLTLKALVDADGTTTAGGAAGELLLRLEDEVSLTTWSGKYTAAYVEEMTRKTGNYKRFPVFVEMILSSMKRTSKSVFLDFLTAEDLNSMKPPATNTPAAAAIGNLPSLSSKIYFILTYAIAFDRIHYPLPMIIEDFSTSTNITNNNNILSFTKNKEDNNPAPPLLVGELKHQIQVLTEERKGYIESHASVRKENDKLRHELKQLMDSVSKLRSANKPSTSQQRQQQTRPTVRLGEAYEMEAVGLFDKIRALLVKNRIDPDVGKAIGSHLWRLEDIFLEMASSSNPFSSKKKNPSTARAVSSSAASAAARRSGSIEAHGGPPSSQQQSRYNIIKSQPLVPSIVKKSSRSNSSAGGNTRQQHQRQTVATTPLRGDGSSNAVRPRVSPSPSRGRFDPTAYIRERDKKLEERRSRSRGNSVTSSRRSLSVGSNRSLASSSSTGNNHNYNNGSRSSSSKRYTHTTRSSSAKNIKNSTSASTKYHNPPKYEKVVYKKSDKFKEVQVKGGGIIPSRRKLPQHQQPLMNDKQSHRPVPVNAVDDNGRRSPSFSLDELHVDYDLLEIDKRLESLHQFLMSTQIE